MKVGIDNKTVSSAEMMRRRLMTLVRLGIALYALGCLIGGGVLLLFQEDRSTIEFARTAYTLLILPVPLFVLMALIVFRRWLMALLLPLTVVWVLYWLPLFVSRGNTAPPDAPVVSVLSFNILTYYEGYEDVVSLIEEADADIVALQQISFEIAAVIEDYLAERYPYRQIHPQTSPWQYYRGQAVLSKYPILEDEYWLFEDLDFYSHGQQRSVVEIDGQPVVVYNVHPWAAFLWEGRANISFPQVQDDAHRIATLRLLEQAKLETLPVIFAGDFNMSDQFFEYGAVSEHFTDSYRAVGYGAGMTYPACGLGPLPALIRLDYVFHSAHFASLSSEVRDACGVSDHHAVLTYLALTGI